MTREQILALADVAGIVTGENLRFPEGYRYRSHGTPRNVREQALLDFAELVANCAAAAEREECAKVADELAHDWHLHAKGGPAAVYNACAAAIRARGQT